MKIFLPYEAKNGEVLNLKANFETLLIIKNIFYKEGKKKSERKIEKMKFNFVFYSSSTLHLLLNEIKMK